MMSHRCAWLTTPCLHQLETRPHCFSHSTAFLFVFTLISEYQLTNADYHRNNATSTATKKAISALDQRTDYFMSDILLDHDLLHLGSSIDEEQMSNVIGQIPYCNVEIHSANFAFCSDGQD